MPCLPDPKREKFAQLVARGLPLAEAHERAGYKRNTGNASTLSRKPDIRARVEELKLGTGAVSAAALMDHLRENGIDQSYIIKAVAELAERAMKKGDHKVALDAYVRMGSELFGMFGPVSQKQKNDVQEPASNSPQIAFEKLTRTMDKITLPPAPTLSE